MNNKAEYVDVFLKLKSGELQREEAVKKLKRLWMEKKEDTVLYTSAQWQETEIREDAIGPANVLLFNSDFLSDNMVQSLSEKYKLKLYRVNRGDDFSKIDEYNYVVNYKENGFNKLFFSFNESFKIIYILNNYPDVLTNNLDKIFDNEIIPLFLLFSSLLCLRLDYKTEVLVVYNSTTCYLHSVYQGISGLVRTLAQESRKVSCKIVETDTLKNDFTAIVNEIFYSEPEEFEVKWEKNKKYVKRFSEIIPGSYDDDHISFNEKGIYLITGGAGGIGLKISEYLSVNYKANLILTGRSTINAEKNTEMRKLIASGADILYVQADITLIEDVKKLLEIIRNKYNRLDGIIHAAGIVKDAYIHKKTVGEIQSVIKPKIYGTLNLDILSKEVNPDFFILFSSLSSNGNPGQADYAYANSFLDDFAVVRNRFVEEKKRFGKTIAINWPYWAEGGMQINQQTLQLMERNSGIRPLKTSEGLDALLFAMKSGESRIMVLPGNRQKIMNTILSKKKHGINESLPSEKILNKKIKNELQEFIKSQMAHTLKVEKNDIDILADMSEYGFDSVSFTTLASTISSQYHLNIVPTIFFEYPTIESFVQYLLNEYHEIFKEIHTKEESQNSDSASLNKDKMRKVVDDMNKFLIAEIATFLKLNTNDISAEANLSEYGFDSASYTSIANIINSKYKLNLTPAVFFEYPTIASFVQFLITEYEEKLIKDIDLDKEDLIILTNKDEDLKTTIDGDILYETSRFLPVTGNGSMAGINSDFRNTPIAIIGMAGIFPGADNLFEYWNNLEEMKDCIREIPIERWDWKEYWGDPLTEENKTNVKWGGFINNIDKFDAAFFNISPREAAFMDPQHRLLLELVWHTIEDAGYRASDLSETAVGVFIGVQNAEYGSLMKTNNISIDAYIATGNSHALLANRISYFFNFTGPSEATDTACASSLIMIHRAIQSIYSGDCDQAIVGAVNTLLDPHTFIMLNKSGALSIDGRCRTFDKNANGYVRAEGSGVILLKPFEKAVNDKDFIYAIIKGSAENHGGRAKSLTAPNPNAQAALIVKAMERAHVDPATITYIEAHGTGTSLGDPIEINGLKKAYKELYKKWNKNDYGKIKHCGISSVKTNIGHLETGAGIAGIIKILLSLQRKKLPGTVHFNALNPYIQLEDSPFYIIKETQEWKQIKDSSGQLIPRRAAISSFGIGGANAHIVLEEYNQLTSNKSGIEKEKYIILVSAKTQDSLKAYIAELYSFVRNNKIELIDLEYTLAVGREEFSERVAFLVANYDELLKALQVFNNQGNEQNDVIIKSASKNNNNIDLLLEGEDGKEYIDFLIAKRNLRKLGMLWVAGQKIGWRNLLNDSGARRKPLPVYAFEKERHWIDNKETPKMSYYKIIWEETRTETAENICNNIILFDNDDQLFKKYSEFSNPILVRTANVFEKKENNVYYINYEKEDDYKLLLEALNNTGLQLNSLVFLWSLSSVSTIKHELFENDKILLSNLYPVFYIAKWLAKLTDINTRVKFLFFSYLNAVEIPPYNAAVAGLMKVVKNENPNLSFSMIEVEKAIELEKLFQIIQSELPIELDVNIRYQKGIRFTKKIISINDTSQFPYKFRMNGIYIIAGGAGGLGLELVKYLVNAYNARIIILGRSNLSNRINEKICQMEKNGAIIKYFQCDISDVNNVEYVYSEIKKTFQTVHGIIQAAGIIDDSSITKKDVETFRNVVSPKIKGTINLDWIFKNEKLDFFILFSSISSVLGNPGQCDYAAGNAFLDSFAEYRYQLQLKQMRFGKTVAINWPLWQGGGMHTNRSTLDKMQQSGLFELPINAGIKALEVALTIAENQIVMLYGYADKVDAFLLHHYHLNNNNQKNVDNSIFKNTDYNNISQIIKEIIVNVLHLKNRQINENTALSDYGMDSINSIEIFKNISQRFNLKIKLSDMEKLITVRDCSDFVYQSENTMDQVEIEKNKLNLVCLDDSQKNIILKKYKEAFREYADKIKIIYLKSSKGITIEILKAGKGEPVIFLPGIGSLMTFFKNQIMPFSQNYQVIIFNYPGCGLSEFRKDIADFQSISEILIEVIKLLHIEKPINLVGYSFGGCYALFIAHKYPEYVKSLVLSNCPYKVTLEDSIESIELFINSLIEDVNATIPSSMSIERNSLIYSLNGSQINEIKFHYFSELFKTDLTEKLESIHAPTLIFGCEKDKMVPIEMMKFITANIPDTKYIEISTASHTMPITHYEEYNKQVLDFIDNL